MDQVDIWKVLNAGGTLAFACAVWLELRELRRVVTTLLTMTLPKRAEEKRDDDD